VPPVLAAIPYTTFPSIELGPVTLRTFGIMVALGVVVGISVAARLGEQIGRPADDTINLGVKLVVAGVVGARITWVLTHLDQIDSPIDLIAVWEGGLQFSGGFIGAVLLGLPVFLRWDRLTRWRMLDRCMLGLAVGLAIGRIGCYAVGEHLGGPTSFPLASRYDGGSTREGNGGEGRLLQVGDVIHNTSLYEMLHVFVLSAVLWWLIRRRSTPGTAIGVFLVWIGVGRFATDFLRIYDDTVAGLTGAQLMCLVLVPVGLWALLWVRPRLAGEAAAAGDAPGAGEEPGDLVPDDDVGGSTSPGGTARETAVALRADEAQPGGVAGAADRPAVGGRSTHGTDDGASSAPGAG
jgi:phosphatidylglycerol:prolipoprotein diacylglycerol transferase